MTLSACGKPGPSRDLQELVTTAEGQAEHAATSAVRICKPDHEVDLGAHASAAAQAYGPLFSILALCARSAACVDPGTLPAWVEERKSLPDAERSWAEKTRAALAKVLGSKPPAARREAFARLYDAGAVTMPAAAKVIAICGNPARSGEVSLALAELDAKRAALRAEAIAVRKLP